MNNKSTIDDNQLRLLLRYCLHNSEFFKKNLDAKLTMSKSCKSTILSMFRKLARGEEPHATTNIKAKQVERLKKFYLDNKDPLTIITPQEQAAAYEGRGRHFRPDKVQKVELPIIIAAYNGTCRIINVEGKSEDYINGYCAAYLYNSPGTIFYKAERFKPQE